MKRARRLRFLMQLALWFALGAGMALGTLCFSEREPGMPGAMMMPR